jgi:protein-tyrosine phosphatase
MAEDKSKILFVCLGNICRSPAAEAIFLHKLEERGLSGKYFVDSAGLNGYHNGEEADSRMRTHAAGRGYSITSISRKIKREDFEQFDHIIGMDDSNIGMLKALAKSNQELGKISKITDFARGATSDYVPDPYYGGGDGFENVLDILEISTESFLNYIES